VASSLTLIYSFEEDLGISIYLDMTKCSTKLMLVTLSNLAKIHNKYLFLSKSSEKQNEVLVFVTIILVSKLGLVKTELCIVERKMNK
jgi:hypothetical protein